MKRRSQNDLKALVVDIGGSHVKCIVTGYRDPVRFRSGSAAVGIYRDPVRWGVVFQPRKIQCRDRGSWWRGAF